MVILAAAIFAMATTVIWITNFIEHSLFVKNPFNEIGFQHLILF